MSRSRFHRSTAVAESRAVNPTSTFSGWNDFLSVTGVVPPHGYDYLNRAGVNVTARTVLSIGVVQRCLEVLQNSFFVMGPPRAYREMWEDDGIEWKQWIPRTDRTFPSVLNTPWGTSPFADNAAVPYNIGIGRTVASMGLFGQSWWLTTDRDYAGNPSALEVLHPSFIEMGPAGKPPDSIWYGTSGAKLVELDPEDLIPIPRLILPGDRTGVNPIQTEAPLFAIAIAAVQYSQMWFAQGGQASYILTTENKLNQDDIDRIFEHILLEHSGLQKTYTPLILDSGVKPEMVQADPDKSQMTQTLQYVREEIAGYFGVPLHLVGATGDSGNVWGKGIQEVNYGYADFTLSGYRVPIEEAFTSITPRGQGVYLNERKLFRASSADRAHLVQMNRLTGVTSPDDERRFQDLPPKNTAASQAIDTPLNTQVRETIGPPGGAAGGASAGSSSAGMD